MKTILPVSLVTSVGTKIWVAQSENGCTIFSKSWIINLVYTSEENCLTSDERECKMICTFCWKWCNFFKARQSHWGVWIKCCRMLKYHQTEGGEAGIDILHNKIWPKIVNPCCTVLYTCILRSTFSLHRGDYRAQTFHNSTFVVSIKL